MSAVKKFLPVLLFGAIWGFILWQVEPPASFAQATFSQILLFFVPLFLLLTSLINLYTRFLLKSIILGLGLSLLLVLKALNFFNLLTIPTVLLVTLFIAKLLKQSAKRSSISKTQPPIKPRWLKIPEIKPETPFKKPKLSRLPKQR